MVVGEPFVAVIEIAERADCFVVVVIPSRKVIVAINLAIREPGVPFHGIGLALDIDVHDLLKRMEDAVVKEHFSRCHIAQRGCFEEAAIFRCIGMVRPQGAA
jgi:hypothetical protein